MKMNQFHIPIYGIMIILSLAMGMLFQIHFLKKKQVAERDINLFLILYFFYAVIGGMTLTYWVNHRLGLSSYGGAIGVLVAALIFEKIKPSNGVFLRSVVFALPLIYAVSKLGCLFAGCCYGIPYDGVLAIQYTFGEQAGNSLFPVQLAETIVFLMLFFLCLKMQDKEHIIGITMILMAFSKFMLDYLRNSHVNQILSLNQMISIVFIVIGMILIIRKQQKNS